MMGQFSPRRLPYQELHPLLEWYPARGMLFQGFVLTEYDPVIEQTLANIEWTKRFYGHNE